MAWRPFWRLDDHDLELCEALLVLGDVAHTLVPGAALDVDQLVLHLWAHLQIITFKLLKFVSCEYSNPSIRNYNLF